MILPLALVYMEFRDVVSFWTKGSSARDPLYWTTQS